MTTAVLGSTGCVGSEIVRGLPARGGAVRAFSEFCACVRLNCALRICASILVVSNCARISPA